MSAEIHFHFVSGSAEGSLKSVTKVATELYPEVPIREHIYATTKTKADLVKAIRRIERNPGIVLHELADPALARELEQACIAAGCPCLPMPPRTATNLPAAQVINSVVRLQLETPRRSWFQLGAGLFAGFLALQALWILIPNAIRPAVDFPGGGPALADKPSISGAYISAWIGLVRGELWTDYALALLAAPSHDGSPILRAREAAKRSLELSPHSSSTWLLLAMLEEKLSPRSDIAGELKMSYYTGPNQPLLRPLRLTLALAGDSLSDPELQDVVEAELGAIIKHEPKLKLSIVAAYRAGSPLGRRFLESKLATLDPQLLATVRSIQ
jgi:hypothetical protein